MPPPDVSKPSAIAEDTQNRTRALSEAQGKNFKTAIMNMFRDLKEDRNKCLNEVCGNTNGSIK